MSAPLFLRSPIVRSQPVTFVSQPGIFPTQPPIFSPVQVVPISSAQTYRGVLPISPTKSVQRPLFLPSSPVSPSPLGQSIINPPMIYSPRAGQTVLSSRTVTRPTQIITPRMITTNQPVTISTSQKVTTTQISTIERPLDIIISRSIQTSSGTYPTGQSIRPSVRYEQVRTITPRTIVSSHPGTITSQSQIFVRQPANIITTRSVSRASRPSRIISTS